jgi:hypothetical protein
MQSTGKMKYEPKRAETNCESCIHFVYDEDFGDYGCEVDLDEDEMGLYASRTFRSCPYYQYKDEYINVRKQI